MNHEQDPPPTTSPTGLEAYVKALHERIGERVSRQRGAAADTIDLWTEVLEVERHRRFDLDPVTR